MAQIGHSILLVCAALFLVASCARVERTEVGYTGEEHYGEGDYTRLTRRDTLDALDVNRDNLISREEWKSAKDRGKGPDGDFNRIDKDLDGQVSSAEIFDYLKERVRYGSISNSRMTESSLREDYSEAEPSYLKLNLFSFPIQ